MTQEHNIARDEIIEECARAFYHLRDQANPCTEELWYATRRALKNAAPQDTSGSGTFHRLSQGGNEPAVAAPVALPPIARGVPAEVMNAIEWIASDWTLPGKTQQQAKVVLDYLRSATSTAECTSPRQYWEQGVSDAITYLGGSTFGAGGMETVRGCLALLRSLKENSLFGPRPQSLSSSTARIDIPAIIRSSTWKTPELRESAAKLVQVIIEECK